MITFWKSPSRVKRDALKNYSQEVFFQETTDYTFIVTFQFCLCRQRSMKLKGACSLEEKL